MPDQFTFQIGVALDFCRLVHDDDAAETQPAGNEPAKIGIDGVPYSGGALNSFLSALSSGLASASYALVNDKEAAREAKLEPRLVAVALGDMLIVAGVGGYPGQGHYFDGENLFSHQFDGTVVEALLRARALVKDEFQGRTRLRVRDYGIAGAEVSFIVRLSVGERFVMCNRGAAAALNESDLRAELQHAADANAAADGLLERALKVDTSCDLAVVVLGLVAVP